MEAENEVFKLCKQVYEATGWFEVSDFYVKSFTKKDDFKNALWEIESYSSYAEHMTKEEFSQSNTVPLYTSDYLLEKLPFLTKYTRGDGRIAKGWCYLVLTYANDGQSVATYANRNKEWIEPFYSDTPLKALLKLTLKLHEEEVL